MNDPDEMDGAEGDSKSWYVIQTKPGCEHRANANLLNQEVETFLPLYKTQQYRNGKRVERIRPLFPGYLFARFDLTPYYDKVRWTRGVNKVLGTGEGPIPISGKIVRVIKDRLGEDNLVRLEEGLKEGDAVRVTSGPLKDLMGVFQKKMSNRGRVRILLSLIGVDLPVQIPHWQIEKVS